MSKERELLEAFGCKEIEYTNLINNYLISFTYEEKRFTVEHTLSVYGASVNFWELSTLSKTFSTLEELLDYIK